MNQRRRKKLSRRLFNAIPVGDMAVVKAVLEAGADPERADSEGTTPLYAASVNGEGWGLLFAQSKGDQPVP